LEYKTHEVLYRDLMDITYSVKKCLGENDSEMLIHLAKEHKHVINEIKQAGFSRDPQLLDLVKETNDQVREVVAEIIIKRDQIGRRLNAVGNKKKLARTYRQI